MLALTIMPYEFVKVGPEITIYNRGDERMYIAIEAPRDIRIERVNPRTLK